MDNFAAKCGITVTVDNPEASSADVVNAIKSLAGQDRAPDAVDVGTAFADFGGYISIGCDATRVQVCPETFTDLAKPEYKGKVALTGDPLKSNSALMAVWSAALANGGSLDEISPSTGSPSTSSRASWWHCWGRRAAARRPRTRVRVCLLDRPVLLAPAE